MRPGSGVGVRAKAVLAAAGTVAVAFALCMVVLVLAVQHNLRASADADAKQTALALQDQLARHAIGPDAAAEAGAPGRVTVRDEAGRTVAATDGDAYADDKAARDAATGTEDASAARSGKRAETAGPDGSTGTAGTAGTAGADGPATAYKVQVTPSTTALDNATALLLRQVAPAAAGLALFVAALTWWLVGRALRPVAAIRREFTEITERDLHRRVPVPRARDEIHRLARTMNATLDRLHRAMTRQRQFVADASHELRSPIAVLRAQLELLLARPSRTDWPTAVHKALQDTERLQAVASDLLLLARLDAQEAPPTAAVDLTALAVEEVRRHPDTVTLAESRDEAVVTGSRVRLCRLLTNLTDNARRHARTTVSVAVRAEDGMVELTVDDDGTGIPEGDRERVFERFTRLDDARARQDGGTGLGLAIARDIARAHGGTLTAGAGPLGGARLRLLLPHR